MNQSILKAAIEGVAKQGWRKELELLAKKMNISEEPAYWFSIVRKLAMDPDQLIENLNVAGNLKSNPLGVSVRPVFMMGLGLCYAVEFDPSPVIPTIGDILKINFHIQLHQNDSLRVLENLAMDIVAFEFFTCCANAWTTSSNYIDHLTIKCNAH